MLLRESARADDPGNHGRFAGSAWTTTLDVDGCARSKAPAPRALGKPIHGVEGLHGLPHAVPRTARAPRIAICIVPSS